jgi:hypothetical protein
VLMRDRQVEVDNCRHHLGAGAAPGRRELRAVLLGGKVVVVRVVVAVVLVASKVLLEAAGLVASKVAEGAGGEAWASPRRGRARPSGPRRGRGRRW